MPDVQQDELLLRVLREAQLDASGEGALTAPEIARKLGRGYDQVRELLLRLKAEGKIEVVYVWRTGLDDRPHRVPAYRLRLTRG